MSNPKFIALPNIEKIKRVYHHMELTYYVYKLKS